MSRKPRWRTVSSSATCKNHVISKCFYDTQHSYPCILLHIVIIGIGYFDGALLYWMDIEWGYVSCLKYQRSRNSHGWIVDIVSCAIWWLLPALPLLAVCGLQHWLQLGFVAIHTFQPAIRGPEKTSFDLWCNFYFIHLAYCSPETPHECSILRSSCTVDTFASIHNMDMI